MSWKAGQILLGFMLASSIAVAQTDADGIMMKKQQICNGITYSYSSWDHYWEGTHKRINDNFGTVSSQSLAAVTNYGITDKLNVLASVPYVTTKASAGQLHGMKGLQDISVWLKYLPLQLKAGAGKFSFFLVTGVSLPLSDYNPDFLPLSIGLHSRTLSLRGMIDYQRKNIFATVSGAYTERQNIKLFRNSYYTTEMHYTNEVRMPDVAQFMVSGGLRSKRLIAEVIATNITTLGGFDITKNNMPFPSNKMNSTSVGANLKYYFKNLTGLSVNGGANFVLNGRNVGQAKSYAAGAFYVMNFKKHQSKFPTTNTQ